RHHLRRTERHAAIVVRKHARRDVGDVVDLQRVIARPQESQCDPRAEGADADYADVPLSHAGGSAQPPLIFSASSRRNRSVSIVPKWIEGLRLSTICEPMARCPSTKRTALRARAASWRTNSTNAA